MSERLEIVPFHEHQIATVKTEESIYVVMKPIVEALGMTWHGQFERMNRHPVLSKGIRVTRIPSAGGAQEAVTLNLEQFHGWLVTLAPDRIADLAKRELIVRYQTEAFRVVFEHFHGKIGRPRDTKQSVSSRIATQNHIMKLMRRLQSTYHPQERRALHQMLHGMCQDVGIDTPNIESLGQDALPVPETLDRFWRAVDLLHEWGYDINLSRKPNVLALHIKSLGEAMAKERLGVHVDTALYRALQRSTAPKYITRKIVNCKDGKARNCWVFEAPPRRDR